MKLVFDISLFLGKLRFLLLSFPSFLSFPFLFFVRQKVSLCSPFCCRTHYVYQTGLELIDICLPLSPECWDERRAPPLLSGVN